MAPASRQASFLLRAFFWLTALATFVLAVMPPRHGPPLLPWDKAQHFVAFYVLMVLALVSFPRASPWLLAGCLSAFGALIEVVQGLPLVHRDADVKDWLADSLAIAAVLLPLYMARWRR